MRAKWQRWAMRARLGCAGLLLLLGACRETQPNPCFGQPPGAVVEGRACGGEPVAADATDAAAPAPEAGTARDAAVAVGRDGAVPDAAAAMFDADVADDGGTEDPVIACACPASAPRCSDAGTCLPCTGDAHCDAFADTPRCRRADGRCVQCLNERTDCSPSAPACDDDNRCVECTRAEYCASGVCNTLRLQCVECTASRDCLEASRARCDVDAGACATCLDDADCAHLPEAMLCEGGTCVQCLLRDERACGETSCNPARNACTSTRRGTLGSCEPCVADSECAGGGYCMPMAFAGTALPGGFCLPPAGTCVEPYLWTTLHADSLSGALDVVTCGIDQTLTTCAAMLAMGEPCASSDECTETGFDDAVCDLVNASSVPRCSYHCANSMACPAGAPCLAGYCGGAE